MWVWSMGRKIALSRFKTLGSMVPGSRAESLRPHLPNMTELEGPQGTTRIVRRMKLPARKDKCISVWWEMTAERLKPIKS